MLVDKYALHFALIIIGYHAEMKMPSISYAYPKLIPWQNLIIGTSVWKKDSDDINIYYQFDSYRYVSGAPSVVLCCI